MSDHHGPGLASRSTDSRSAMHPRTSILKQGDNCSDIVRADRIAFLVDAEAYYTALSEGFEAARHSILIVGWDLHSRLVLRRDGDDRGECLGDLLNRLATERPDLHVNILGWDFALIYAIERESLPLFRFGIQGHRRIHFRLDGVHPLGASRHQKIVVVDDSIAFAGGLDLTANRWDTREHRPDDARRVTPSGEAYEPFHDIQMAVDGDAALFLGEMVRERWGRVNGRKLPAPPRHDVWPSGLRPDLGPHDVAIVRTEPEWPGQPEVREVEKLYLDAIGAARRTIYIENQYFTSSVVVEALAERLRDPTGPEVVLVLPRRCSGWLEEATMGALRRNALATLRDADPEGRLWIYFPVSGSEPWVAINVHSKTMVVDESFVRVGSANLNNRSMGLDAECDLAFEADGDAATRAIRCFRDDLLAEHLGVTGERVSAAHGETGSLGRAIERLRADADAQRTLRPLEPEEEGETPLDAIVPDAATIVDPERPVEVEAWIAERAFEGERDDRSTIGPWVRVVAVAAPLVALVLFWRTVELGGDDGAWRAWVQPYLDTPWEAALVVGAIAGSSVLAVPVTVLIVATALGFGGWLGFVYSAAGVFGGALVGYGIGRLLWRDAVRALGGRRLNDLSRKLGEKGLLAVVFVRVVPVAPFAIVNLVAGASHVRFGSYVLGTVLGMMPGIALMSLFADRVGSAIQDPSFGTAAVAIALGVAVFSAAWWVQKKLGNPAPEVATDDGAAEEIHA